jgi:hypothetical protein
MNESLSQSAVRKLIVAEFGPTGERARGELGRGLAISIVSIAYGRIFDGLTPLSSSALTMMLTVEISKNIQLPARRLEEPTPVIRILRLRVNLTQRFRQRMPRRLSHPSPTRPRTCEPHPTSPRSFTRRASVGPHRNRPSHLLTTER